MKRVLWAIAVLMSAPAFAQDAGQVKSAKGAVHLERGGQKVAVQVGTPVREGDALVTGADGAAGVTFTDNSLLSVGPSSRLVLDKYAFNSTTNAGRMEASLSKGTLAGISGKMVKQSPDAVRVRTPTVIMGVRGTEFAIRVDPEQASE